MAETLLAKLYLNAEIYTGKSRWSECVTACDAILKSNQYQLESDFFANFARTMKNRRKIFFRHTIRL